ncbi:LysR family transcriptional regulator [Piscinibacter sakaiensis]|uniref:Transcriptional regulator, LysR family n=1 Tax=Piscinibacter sakaiensis TaxID=1547922 RepID=A0A0K8NXR3_PISS1|nr:LysR family transcriptional regulator [Piscinibacter sakaiensis]GAP35187.1 transcriptional regulator, LysR family [Piscinibacter sakaiensis]
MDRVAALRLFVRVVETGSFSRAAGDLALTQPTATKHVAALERRLGARLFHRSTRGVTPTEVGAAYYDKAKRILAELDEADDLAALLHGRMHGQLRLGSSVAFGRRVLVPLALRFMQAHPGLNLELSFEDRYVDLVAQGIDVAVRMGRLADSGLGARYLGRNPWVLTAAPAYLEEAGTPRAAEELAAHRCVVYSSVQGDDRWSFDDAAGRTVTVPVRGPLRSNNLSAVLAACRAGLGLAVLPAYVARESLADGSLVRVLPGFNLPAQDIHAVFPSPKLLPGKVQVLILWLQQALEGEGWWRDGV